MVSFVKLQFALNLKLRVDSLDSRFLLVNCSFVTRAELLIAADELQTVACFSYTQVHILHILNGVINCIFLFQLFIFFVNVVVIIAVFNSMSLQNKNTFLALKKLIQEFHSEIKGFPGKDSNLVIVLDSIDQLRQSDEAFNLSWLVNASCILAVFILFKEEGVTVCKGSTRFDTCSLLRSAHLLHV